jgi:hypothetical protein
MNDSALEGSRQPASTPVEDKGVADGLYLPAEAEQLTPEARTIVSVVSAIFRSNSGPDPETSRIMAETEMHEESCKLEAYTKSLENKNRQSERDHEFRIKQQRYDNLRSIITVFIFVAGIAFGLYLLVTQKSAAVGNTILVACFVALLNGKSLLPKDKE